MQSWHALTDISLLFFPRPYEILNENVVNSKIVLKENIYKI